MDGQRLFRVASGQRVVAGFGSPAGGARRIQCSAGGACTEKVPDAFVIRNPFRHCVGLDYTRDTGPSLDSFRAARAESYTRNDQRFSLNSFKSVLVIILDGSDEAYLRVATLHTESSSSSLAPFPLRHVPKKGPIQL